MLVLCWLFAGLVLGGLSVADTSREQQAACRGRTTSDEPSLADPDGFDGPQGSLTYVRRGARWTFAVGRADAQAARGGAALKGRLVRAARQAA